MKSILFSVTSAATILFALNSCGPNPKSDKTDGKDSGQKVSDIDTSKWNPKFNAYARYMAGMTLPANSGLQADDTFKYYKLHAQEFDARWKEMDKNRLIKMREWAKAELHPKIDKNLNLYYPFSGADFLHANQFFPDAKKSLYIALEQVGDVPDLKTLTPANRIELLKRIDKSLEDIFKRSYFITSYVGPTVARIGYVPIFMVMMARCGYDVLNVELIEINKEGKSVLRKGKSSGVQGVRFTYCPTGNSKDIRTLEYFSADVENRNVDSNRKEILTYVENFGKANVYFKAASYIMHWDNFSLFRKSSLSISENILEDDTGYPLSALEDKYTPYLYGQYVPAIADFPRGTFQPKLAKMYADSANKPKEIPFNLGYHWVDKKQNLMLFTKKK